MPIQDLDLARIDDRSGPVTAIERGREAGVALTEVRTVLSRARTARGRLDRPWEEHRLPKPPSPPGTADMGEPPADRSKPMGYDPEVREMRAALDQTISLLERWEKTGKTKAWVVPVDPETVDTAPNATGAA